MAALLSLIMKNIDINRLKHLYYTEEKSAFEIAEIFGCDPMVIYGRMKKNGMQRRPYSEAQKIRYARDGLNLDLAEIVRLYFEEQLSLKKVGDRLGVSNDTVRKHLLAAGYVPRKRGESRRLRKSPFTDTDLAEMVRLYCVEGQSSMEIASHYNCSDVVVRKVLKRHGVRLRTFKEAQALRRKKETVKKKDVVGGNSDSRLLPKEQVTPERILQLRNEENLTIDAIAARVSLTNLEVFNILQEAGGR